MIKQIEQDVINRLASKPHRLQHTLGVRDTALELGKKYNVDTSKLEIAALLHDATKYYTTEQNIQAIKKHFANADAIITEYNDQILHAFSAVEYASRVYGVTDPDILDAIMSHTVGRPQMSIYEEIIFISDYIEPNRTYPSCVKAREIAQVSLTKAIYTAINDSINYFEKEGNIVPKIAYKARTYYQTK